MKKNYLLLLALSISVLNVCASGGGGSLNTADSPDELQKAAAKKIVNEIIAGRQDLAKTLATLKTSWPLYKLIIERYVDELAEKVVSNEAELPQLKEELPEDVFEALIIELVALRMGLSYSMLGKDDMQIYLTTQYMSDRSINRSKETTESLAWKQFIIDELKNNEALYKKAMNRWLKSGQIIVRHGRLRMPGASLFNFICSAVNAMNLIYNLIIVGFDFAKSGMSTIENDVQHIRTILGHMLLFIEVAPSIKENEDFMRAVKMLKALHVPESVNV